MDKDIKKYIDETAKKVAASIASQNNSDRNCFKQTEARLYAYPLLLKNIRRYKLDIKDLVREGITSKSKSITSFSISAGAGNRLTPQEMQEFKILVVKNKLERDEKEVNELKNALKELKFDKFFFTIPGRYFNKKDDEDLAGENDCDVVTMRRNRSQLVKQLSIILYGADALKNN